MTQPRIGFIGLGMMGHGMAKHLLLKGFPLSFVVHRDRSRLADLVQQGATEVKSPAELARGSDFVILCVTGSPQVEANVYGDAGLLAGAHRGLTVIDTSTAEPASSAKVREAFAAKGIPFVDAPLARTPKEAEEGRLNTMVGADEATFARVKPVMSAFCENVYHVGPAGAGHTLKLVNNFLALTQVAAIAEAFAVAGRAGVPLAKLFEVVSGGGVNSGIFQMMAGGAVAGDYQRMKFSIANAAKDLGYYERLADATGVESGVGSAVHHAFHQALALGLGERMVPSMIEAQEKQSRMPALQP
jgi:3-hydroxyisobutyrate dehydrogenase-like beta-hydroxyacid dehydrogenase